MHHPMTLLAFSGADHALNLTLHYDLRLVFLSWLVACVAAILSLQQVDMASRIRLKKLRLGMVGSGAVVLGIGIWSMHFIGMLAVQLCTPVHYDAALTALSILPGLASAYFALTMLTDEQPPTKRLLLAGVAIGSGIGAMHYLGMAAMQMHAELLYDPLWFLLSLLLAALLAILALWVRFELVRYLGLSRRTGLLWGGVILGTAISGMHYTAMRAALFVGPMQPMAERPANQLVMALTVGLTALGIALLVFALNMLVQYVLSSQALASSRRRMQVMNDAAVDTVLGVSDEGRIESANAAVSRLFGWQRHEVVGADLRMLLPDGIQAMLARSTSFNAAVGTEQQVMEVLGRHRDGHTLSLRMAIGSADLDGRRVFALHLADLSERKAFELALQQRDSRIASLLRNSPGVIFRMVSDPRSDTLRYDFISKAITRLCGVEAQSILDDAAALESLIHADDRPGLLSKRQGAGGASSYSQEYRLQLGPTHTVWISETGDIARDANGQVLSIEGVLLDISENKARSAEFASVYDAIRRGTVLMELNIDGRIIDANDNCLQLFGYRREEIIGQHHAVLCFAEDVEQADYAEHWQALRRGEFRRGDYRRRARDGHTIWMQASYTPVLDPEGRPQRVIKLIHDLSERHEMEDELRQAKEKAELAASVKSTFLANMSHEIRTPLNAIIGFTEVLQETPVSSTQQRYLQTISQSSRTLLHLLNDILDTAKLESGAMELEQTPFSLRQMAEDLVASFALIALRKGVQVQLNYAASCPSCLVGDALRLNQILSNLLSNAVKFTAQGQVSLDIQSSDGGIVLAVRDTGIGIAADRLEQIFEQFAQADASMTRRFGGTGLGTAIAKRLTELMQGHITVESVLGEGSCFKVWLPLRPCTSADGESAAAASPARPVAPSAPLHILVADDVAQNRELMYLQLRRLGHTVSLVEDGQQAIEACAQHAYDLVLMDVHMPVCDGLSATRQIRQEELRYGRPRLPIIALTASVLESERRLALDAGMDGFAFKPIDMPALLAEIEQILGRSAGQAGTLVSAQEAWPHPAAYQQALARLLDEMAATLGDDSSWPSVEVAALAHRWRGAALNLGLHELAWTCAQSENAGSTSVWPELYQQVLALQAGKARPSQQPAAAPAAVDPAALHRLMTLLAAGELDEALFERVCASLEEQRAAQLRDHVYSFDFAEALRVLQPLAPTAPSSQEKTSS